MGGNALLDLLSCWNNCELGRVNYRIVTLGRNDELGVFPRDRLDQTE
jgi:hypothetical protein